MRRLTQAQKDAVLLIMMEGALNEIASREEIANDLGEDLFLEGLTGDEIAETVAHWFFKGRLPKSDVWNSGLPKVWES